MLTPGKRIGLLIIAAVLVAVSVWQFYKYRIINKKIDKALTEKTKGLYNIRYGQIALDEAAGILHVKNVEITPDTAVYRQMADQKTNPPVLVTITMPALDILGVKTPKALLNKQVEGRKIEITQPTIEILLSHSRKDTTVYDPTRDLSKEQLGKLLKMQVDSVSILRANVIVREMRSNMVVLKGSGISCLLSDMQIDSNAVRDSSRMLFARDLDMTCDEMQFPSESKRYKFQMAGLRFLGKDNTLSIGQLKVIPQLPEEEFVRSFPVQKDRYDFSFEWVRLVHISRGGLWHKRIEADSLSIGKSSFKVYRDLSRPGDTTSKVGKYPQQQLMRLPIPVNIRKMMFAETFIEYKEKNGKSDSAGKLRFFHASAILSNVTNMKTAIARDNACTVSFKAKLLDRAPVSARLVLLLNDRRGRFSIEGNVGSIDVLRLNPLTQPMALARMEKGHISNLHFRISATDSASEGRVVLLYEGLKVSLLKKDKDQNKYDKKGLASMMANIMIKNSNPANAKEPRTANVRYRRALNKSFFNVIWKTIFTGIKETVGMK